ncbi:hypothetical protein M9194_06255 [Vibrio sp. S4M6]|uniref:hypothetical protein n=1 Tax=Vibrio sinus TaxID=2946865 RepID=UPI00202AC0B5|nr:hypothetical protein [Vibrio sinus]MCL9781026.1 hypothetical protein [Vibrio sinus]
MPKLQFNCMALTWNLAGEKPSKFTNDILEYFADYIATNGSNPDIIFIGLQEAKHQTKIDQTGGYVSGRIVKSLHYSTRRYQENHKLREIGRAHIKAGGRYSQTGKVGYKKLTREYLWGYSGNKSTSIVLEVFIREDLDCGRLTRAGLESNPAVVEKVNSGTFRDAGINKNNDSLFRSTSHIWKGGCYAVIDIFGQKVGVINAHLDAYDREGREARSYEIQRLVDKVKSGHGDIPMIFMGDLNERLAPRVNETKLEVLERANSSRRDSAYMISTNDKLSNGRVDAFTNNGFQFKPLLHMSYEQLYTEKDVTKARKKGRPLPTVNTIRLKSSERQGPDVGALDNIGFSDDLLAQQGPYNRFEFDVANPMVHRTYTNPRTLLPQNLNVSDHFAVSIPFRINVDVRYSSRGKVPVRYNPDFQPLIDNPTIRLYQFERTYRHIHSDDVRRKQREERYARFGRYTD